LKTDKWVFGNAAMLALLLISKNSLADGDFQFWSSSGASFDVNKDWTGTLDEYLKFGNDAGHLYLHQTDLGFVYGGSRTGLTSDSISNSHSRKKTTGTGAGRTGPI
jgi:hypothetical protein